MSTIICQDIWIVSNPRGVQGELACDQQQQSFLDHSVSQGNHLCRKGVILASGLCRHPASGALLTAFVQTFRS